MLQRRILIGLLALGTVAGFGSGFAQLRHARARWAAYHDAAVRAHDGPCTESAPHADAPPPP